MPQTELKWIFGHSISTLRTSPSFVFIDEKTLLYIAGNQFVFYNLQLSELSFLPQSSPNVRTILSFCLDETKERLFVCEKLQTGNIHFVLYQLKPELKILMIKPFMKEYIQLQCFFCFNNQYVAIVTRTMENEELELSYWNLIEWQLIGRTKLLDLPTVIVRSSLHEKKMMLTVTGSHYFKGFLCFTSAASSDTKLVEMNMLPGYIEENTIVDHIWDKKYCLLLLEQGTVLICQKKEDKGYGNNKPGLNSRKPLLRSSTKRSSVKTSINTEGYFEILQILQLPDRSICLKAFCLVNKGFYVGGTNGFVGSFADTGDVKEPYTLVRKLSTPGERTIKAMDVSLNNENMVLEVEPSEFVYFVLGNVDFIENDMLPLLPLNESTGHSKSIICMDSSSHRDVLITCGMDQMIKIWNYQTLHSITSDVFSESIGAVAIHPTGIQIIVAFKEKIKTYVILYDSFLLNGELNVRNCRQLQYSHGGHYIALTSGINIFVLHAYTYEIIGNFVGHIGYISCLQWDSRDLFLYSTGHDGCFYTWDILKNTRVDEMQHTEKSQNIYGMCSIDREIHLLATNEEIIELSKGEKKRSISSNGIRSLAIGANYKFYAGTVHGSLETYQWSKETIDKIEEISIHQGAILSIHINQKHLFTCGEDGCIRMFVLSETNIEEKVTKTISATPILCPTLLTVLREEYEEKLSMLEEVKEAMRKLQYETTYNLQTLQREMDTKIETLKTAHEKERGTYEETILSLKKELQNEKFQDFERLTKEQSNYMKQTEEIEEQYENKLNKEIRKYDEMKMELAKVKEGCQILLKNEKEEGRKHVENEKENFYHKLDEQNAIIWKLRNDLEYNQKKFEEILQQEEMEYEEEIRTLKEKYTKEIFKEKENTSKKQSEIMAQWNKMEKLEKKMEELTQQMKEKEEIIQKDQIQLQRLEEKSQHYQEHINQRDIALQQKETNLTTLHTSNRILENFRVVLDEEIYKLQEEKIPIVEYVKELELSANDIMKELMEEHEKNYIKQKEIIQKDRKLQNIHNEAVTLRQTLHERDHILNEMKRELTSVVQLSNIHELKDAVHQLYKVYVRGESTGNKQLTLPRQQTDQEEAMMENTEETKSNEVIHEMKRHTDYLNRTIEKLNKTIKHIKQITEKKEKQMIEENKILINQYNAKLHETRPKYKKPPIEEFIEPQESSRNEQGLVKSTPSEELRPITSQNKTIKRLSKARPNTTLKMHRSQSACEIRTNRSKSLC